jgi:hypothetical protein
MIGSTLSLALAAFAVALSPASSAWAATMKYKGKKVLFVNSYHDGYEWSDGEVQGAKNVFKGTGVEFKVYNMDTKNHPEEAFKTESGLKAKQLIEEYKPDAVITSDDNAVIYLTKPYFKDAKIPFIFCGVNWDAAKYGMPYKNTTGMIEVDPIGELYRNLRNYAKGPRIGYIANDNETEHNVADFDQKNFFHENMTKKYFVKTYEEFKKQYIQAQNEVDMLYFSGSVGITGWDEKDAADFVVKHTKIPTGSNLPYMTSNVLMVMGKDPLEQGEWSAKAALKIFDGTAVSAIPQASNKRVKFSINMKLANSLKVTFSPSILKAAQLIGGVHK